MANLYPSSNDDIPDSIVFSDQEWQRLRSEYSVEASISSADRRETLERLLTINLAIAAKDLKKILPCLPNKERDRFLQEFGSLLV